MALLVALAFAAFRWRFRRPLFGLGVAWFFAAQALTAAGATVWLAGRPGELEAALNEAGVRSFIYAGCDVLDALRRAHDAA